jgi:hypothetical protein
LYLHVAECSHVGYCTLLFLALRLHLCGERCLILYTECLTQPVTGRPIHYCVNELRTPSTA